MHKKIVAGLFCIIATALYAQDPEELTREGVELGKSQRFEESLKKLDESMQIYNRRSARTLHNIGYVHELKGDTNEAISAYEEAVRRNPIQIPSMERLGFLYYKNELYGKAVEIGEQVLKLEPHNQEVIKWLPDAYKQNLIMIAKAQLEAKKAEEEKKADGRKPQPADTPQEKKRMLYASFDFMFRTGYYHDDRGFELIGHNSMGPNLPTKLYVAIGPYEGWEGRVTTGNPHYGAIMPEVTAWMERAELLYNAGGYALGFGGLVNHHRSDDIYGENTHENDFKAGLLFNVTRDKAKVDITLYPRLFMRDGENSAGKTFDATHFNFQYTYTFDKYIRYFARLAINEFFFFDHDIPVSHYAGVYDFVIGVILTRYNELTGQKKFSFSCSLTERMYFGDSNVEDPYSKFGNGQGWFGINTGKWTKGDPFSGFRSLSHVVTVGLEGYVANNIFLYQSTGFELTDTSEDHHELTLTFGAGVEL